MQPERSAAWRRWRCRLFGHSFDYTIGLGIVGFRRYCQLRDAEGNMTQEVKRV